MKIPDHQSFGSGPFGWIQIRLGDLLRIQIRVRQKRPDPIWIWIRNIDDQEFVFQEFIANLDYFYRNRSKFRETV